MGESFARIILLLLAFGAALAWSQHGAGGVAAWTRAKLLGRP